jgi:hypothetical protein
MDRRKFANELRAFLDGNAKRYEFDDLTSTKYDDPLLEQYRSEILRLPDLFPADAEGSYVSKQGLQRLRQIVVEVESAGNPGFNL